MKLIDADVFFDDLRSEGYDVLNIDYTDHSYSEFGYSSELIRKVIEKQKTIEARPVVHGSWLSYLDGDHIMPDVYYKCSKCGSRGHEQRWRYCPSCGAKMDG